MYKATLRDKAFVVNLLTSAFDDNKSVNFVVRQDVHRVERIKHLMDYAYNVCNTFGEIWISDDHAACALLVFPDRKRITLNSILWDLKLVFLVIGIGRLYPVLKREKLIKADHPRDAAGFASLWFLAVHTENQGDGIGTTLLGEVLAECKKRERDIYLETSVARNLSFYQRLGFEVYKSIELTYKLYQLRKLIKNAPPASATQAG